MTFRRTYILFILFILRPAVISGLYAQTAKAIPAPVPPSYGANEKAGRYYQVNGIRMYCEVYGKGDPLVLLHDNGGDIKALQKQIPFFSEHYRVIVADSRAHGKSTENGTKLSLELLASDWKVLLDSLHTDSAYVFGWGNGGTIGLLLAAEYPAKVRKLAVLGATIRSDSTALAGWFIDWIRTTRKFTAKRLDERDTTQRWLCMTDLLDLLGNQPPLPPGKLGAIAAPTLVMAGDRDIVRNEHTAMIFENIPNAQLCIFPGATHMLPWEDPDMLNRTIDHFFRSPFSRPDTREYY